ELSRGKTGLRDLMLELSKTYGKDNAFKDDELFDKITELTYPEIREFFKRHVEGPEPLPLEETFRKVGIIYEAESNQRVNSYGSFVPGYDQEAQKISIAETEGMDAFGRKMGFKQGDLLLKWNGTEITPMNVRELIGEELQKMKPGSDITVTVSRKDVTGKVRERQLKGKVTEVERQVAHLLQLDP